MRLLAVSDLHIKNENDPLYASLLRLLRDRTHSGDVVVLVGDIFDFFIGGKSLFVERYNEFLKALKEASSRGVKIHYIEGNHDFQLKRAFSQAAQIHTKDFPLTLGSKRFFFAHGDLADREDYGYRALRLLFRSPLTKAFVAVMPSKAIDAIGNGLSSKSRKTKPLLPAAMLPSDMERLRKVYRSFAAEKLAQGYDFVVMGHCHDLDEMKFNIGGRPGQYINVGYPRAHGSYLIWEEGDAEIQREKLPGV